MVFKGQMMQMQTLNDEWKTECDEQQQSRSSNHDQIDQLYF